VCRADVRVYRVARPELAYVSISGIYVVAKCHALQTQKILDREK
jgi:hypothetical protein